MWDGNSIFNLPRKHQDNQGHIAPCSLSCAQDSRAPSPQHLALSSFVSLHFVGLRTDPTLWCFREIFRRGVMHARCTFFGCVCVRMHSCTYTCAQFMDGGQKTAFRSHFSHIMLVPGSSSGGQYCCYTFTHRAVLLPMSIFLLLFMLWVSQ